MQPLSDTSTELNEGCSGPLDSPGGEERSPREWYCLHLAPLFALTALTASAALLVDTFQKDPLFCSFEMGCSEVLASPYARPLGVPLPVVGVVTFLVLFGLALFPRTRSHLLFKALALAAGVAGLGLILVQALVIGHACPFCLLVDGSALALAGAVLLVRKGAGGALSRPARAAWAGAAVLVAGVTVALGLTAGSAEDNRPVPAQVRAYWVPGKVTVVEVVDFQCPHCRRMHAVVLRLLEEQGKRIHFVRLTAPMPAHAQARPASRAFLCAEKLGQGNAMAEALFQAEDLSAQACEAQAKALQVPLGPFRTCVESSATDQQIDATNDWLKEASPQGLPVLWIQERMLFGMQSLETLREEVLAAQLRLEPAAP